MKKQLILIITTLLVSIGTATYAQSFNYQAVLRNNAGAILASQAVELRFSIRDGSQTGTIEYRETAATTTSPQGMISHGVGTGTADLGTFSGIGWGTGIKFLQVELSIAGGPYVNLGNEQLASVPNVFHADYVYSADTASMADTVSYARSAGENVSFMAKNTAVQTFTASGTNAYPFDLPQVVFNEGGGALTHGAFTVPSAGLYHFDVNIVLDPSTSNSTGLYLVLGTDAIASTFNYITILDEDAYLSISALVKLNTGDQVMPFFQNINDISTLATNSGNYFSGYKVR